MRRKAWAALASLVLCGALQAEPALPGGASLGMSTLELRQAVPGLQPLTPAIRMAGGLRGGWSGPPLRLAGVSFTPVYFFAEDRLRRVEYTATPAAQALAPAFEAVRAWGRAQWGDDLGAENPEGSYAAWVTPDADAYLQAGQSAGRSVLRLVFKPRVLKEAGEL